MGGLFFVLKEMTMNGERFDENFTWHEWTFVAPDDSREGPATEPRSTNQPETDPTDPRFQTELALFFESR